MKRCTIDDGDRLVRVWQEALRWEKCVHGFRVLVGEGLAMSVQPEHEWTIMSARSLSPSPPLPPLLLPPPPHALPP